MSGVLGGGSSGEKQGGAERDEGGNDSDLDHGEPEFEASVAVDAEQVDGEKEGGKGEDPEDGLYARKPEVHVGGGGDHLGSDGDGDGEPIAGAGDEARPVIEVEVSIDTEGTGGGMSAGEFAEGERDGPADESGEDEAEDDGGAGEFDSCGSAEEESGADGAADGDHGHLSGGELMAESGLWVRRWSVHEGSYSYTRSAVVSGGEKAERCGEAEARSAWTGQGPSTRELPPHERPPHDYWLGGSGRGVRGWLRVGEV